jgi:hypothetical protein
MIPSVSSDQYSATLAKWLGVDSCDIGTIFPYVGNFPAADSGSSAERREPASASGWIAGPSAASGMALLRVRLHRSR